MLVTNHWLLSLPAETEEKGRAASWPFALVLLGLAAVLIATAAEYPGFFAVGLDHLGAEVPITPLRTRQLPLS